MSALPVDTDEIRQARQALESIGAEQTLLAARAREQADVLEALLAEQAEQVLAPRRPADVWDDPDLLAFLIDRSWNRGRGDARAEAFLNDAIGSLAPGCFYDFETILDDGYAPTGIRPQLRLTRGQDTAAARAALLRMLPALSGDGDGAMTVAVFEHTLSEHGSVTLTVLDDDHAWILLRQRVQATGTLAQMLDQVAADHYYQDRR